MELPVFKNRLEPQQWAKVNRSVPAGKVIEFDHGSILVKGSPPLTSSKDLRYSGLYADDDRKMFVAQHLIGIDPLGQKAHIWRFWKFSEAQVAVLRHLS